MTQTDRKIKMNPRSISRDSQSRDLAAEKTFVQNDCEKIPSEKNVNRRDVLMNLLPASGAALVDLVRRVGVQITSFTGEPKEVQNQPSSKAD